MRSLLSRLFGRGGPIDLRPDNIEAAVASGELVPYHSPTDDRQRLLVSRDDDRRILLQAARTLHWDNAEALRHLALQCLAAQYCTEAVEICRQLLSLCPDDKDAQVYLGASLLGDENLGEAERVLTEHINKYPQSSYGYANLAKVYYQTGREDKAREAVQSACECDPDNTNALTMYYFELMDEGGQEAVVATMTDLARRNPDAWGPWWAIAQHFDRVGDVRRGVLYVRKALDRGPNAPELLYYASGYLGENGLLDELIETLESARRHGYVPPEALYNLTRAYIDIGDNEAARRVLDELEYIAGPRWRGLLWQLEEELDSTGV